MQQSMEGGGTRRPELAPSFTKSYNLSPLGTFYFAGKFWSSGPFHSILFPSHMKNKQ